MRRFARRAGPRVQRKSYGVGPDDAIIERDRRGRRTRAVLVATAVRGCAGGSDGGGTDVEVRDGAGIESVVVRRPDAVPSWMLGPETMLTIGVVEGDEAQPLAGRGGDAVDRRRLGAETQTDPANLVLHPGAATGKCASSLVVRPSMAGRIGPT